MLSISGKSNISVELARKVEYSIINNNHGNVKKESSSPFSPLISIQISLIAPFLLS